MDEFLDDESKEKTNKEQSNESKPNSADKGNDDDQFVEKGFSNEIKLDIDEIKKLLFDEKFEQAHEKYMITKEKFLELRKQHLEEQNKIYSSLESINKQMVDSLNTSRQDAQNKIIIIEQLIAKIKVHISKNELELANQLFTQISELYEKLPDLLPQFKLKIENEISNLHIALSQKNALVDNADFQQKINNINQLLNAAIVNLKNGKIDIATNFYQKINIIFTQLPKGYLYEKAVLYQKILALFKELHLVQNKSTSMMTSSNVPTNQNTPVQNTGGEQKPIKKGFFK
jgi:hypothetical protein